MKTCTKCGKTKPFSEFNRRAASKDGYQPLCRECQHGRDRAYYAQNAERIKAQVAAYRQANQDVVRERNRDWYRRNAERVKARVRANWWANRERNLAYHRAYYRRHRKRLLAQCAAYYRRNRERIIAYSRDWYRRNRERQRLVQRRYRLAHAEKLRAYYAAWRRANPQKVQEYRRRYEESLRQNTVAPVTMREIYTRDRGICQVCGQYVPKPRASLDHIIPISRGGVHAPWNVQLTHVSCNRRRSAGYLPAQLRFWF